MADAMPGIHTLFFTDATGTILAANQPALIGKNMAASRFALNRVNITILIRSTFLPPFKLATNGYVFNLTKTIPS